MISFGWAHVFLKSSFSSRIFFMSRATIRADPRISIKCFSLRISSKSSCHRIGGVIRYSGLARIAALKSASL
jgi:hypothetical protein